MKIHPPIFVLALLIIIIPIIGLPQIYEQIILAILGLAIIILVSSIRLFGGLKNKNKISNEPVLENKVEIQ